MLYVLTFCRSAFLDHRSARSCYVFHELPRPRRRSTRLAACTPTVRGARRTRRTGTTSGCRTGEPTSLTTRHPTCFEFLAPLPRVVDAPRRHHGVGVPRPKLLPVGVASRQVRAAVEIAVTDHIPQLHAFTESRLERPPASSISGLAHVGDPASPHGIFGGGGPASRCGSRTVEFGQLVEDVAATSARRRRLDVLRPI